MSTITIVSEFVSGGYSLCELKYPERSRLFSAHADSRSKGVLVAAVCSYRPCEEALVVRLARMFNISAHLIQPSSRVLQPRCGGTRVSTVDCD